MIIPFQRSVISPADEGYVLESLRSGYTQGDGAFTKLCEKWLETQVGCSRALLTSSGTDALEMAVQLAGIEAGDEVIMPSFTFVSTANAVVQRGGIPVFVDIRPDTLNLDETKVAAALSSRTKAIMPVHYAGVACAMEILQDIAEQNQLLVIEDAAHACLASYHGKPLGSWGQLAALSFHQTKNISSGEGGALLINDPQLVQRAEIMRDKGTNRKAFLRGEVDRYSWVDLGSSYLPADFVAALLWSQLEKVIAITSARLEMVRAYKLAFKELAAKGRLQLPFEPSGAEGNGHIFYVLLPDQDKREQLQHHLKRAGIQSVSHYVPLHLAPVARRWTKTSGDLRVTNQVAANILRLPLYPGLQAAEQNFVIQTVLDHYV